jgi:hypothetical protein
VGKPVRLNDREVAQSLEKFGNYGLMSRQVAADGH